ncbi:hypothetical protein BST81_10190 [Leptolyngbya sp. 'hensonii']|uniref:hypothetical protein n=1 Tax=Leptolyngbya sp. 'hensonii' TaxID=1922337 RepID=UPI00094FBFA6|nr:hypothetical protein [Leptolyngbya sp. 'hensonii']OLP18456.1 hypothetical protein BST81_10190 [Leptolyngbya sp. 'hensonii']
MLFLAQGIPAIPDLTHPQELIQFGQQVLQLNQWLLLLVVGVGLVLAALNFSYRPDRPVGWEEDLRHYKQLLRGMVQGLLVVLILIGGFFLCTTLANRYHHWEQSKITQVAGTVAGERVEQPAPLVRYTIEEPYTTVTYVDGRKTEVEKKRKVDRFLSPSSSQAEVKLTQTVDPATTRLIYQSTFSGTYQITNTLDVTQDFIFEAAPPGGYTLLQDYRVEQDSKPLEPQNQGEYNFPLQLAPGESTQIRITYKAQGAPRWVYTANGRILSKFRLTVLADFPNADFASGIVPTETRLEGRGTRFTWTFAENVSVQNPFGVFTATQRFRNTGVLPRLLLLAPGIFLWWLLLLYLSGPMRLQDVAIAAGAFFASLLSLTYASRFIDARLAWGLLLPLLLFFGWGLGRQRQARWGTTIVTLSGAILPVGGFLVPYTGLTLGLAGLLSIAWLLLGYFGGRSQPST